MKRDFETLINANGRINHISGYNGGDSDSKLNAILKESFRISVNETIHNITKHPGFKYSSGSWHA